MFFLEDRYVFLRGKTVRSFRWKAKFSVYLYTSCVPNNMI